MTALGRPGSETSRASDASGAACSGATAGSVTLSRAIDSRVLLTLVGVWSSARADARDAPWSARTRSLRGATGDSRSALGRLGSAGSRVLRDSVMEVMTRQARRWPKFSDRSDDVQGAARF